MFYCSWWKLPHKLLCTNCKHSSISCSPIYYMLAHFMFSKEWSIILLLQLVTNVHTMLILALQNGNNLLCSILSLKFILSVTKLFRSIWVSPWFSAFELVISLHFIYFYHKSYWCRAEMSCRWSLVRIFIDTLQSNEYAVKLSNG